MSAEVERLSVSDVTRLIPETVFAISSFIAKHHFTLGINDSKTKVTEAVIYIIRANHTALHLLAHITLICLPHFKPYMYIARYANTPLPVLTDVCQSLEETADLSGAKDRKLLVNSSSTNGVSEAMTHPASVKNKPKYSLQQLHFDMQSRNVIF